MGEREREIVRKDLVVHGYFSWYGEKERGGGERVSS